MIIAATWQYDGGPTVLIKAGGAARRSRQRLRSEEVDHQAALLGVVVFMRMMRRMRGVMGIRVLKGWDRQWGAGWWWGQTRFEEENLKDDNDDGGEERWGWLNTWSRKILGSRSPTTWPAPFASSSSSSCLPTVFVGNGISISHQLKTDFLNFEGRNFRLPLFWFIWKLYRIIFGPNIAAFQFLKINQRIWFSVFVQEVKKLVHVFLETVLE